MENLTLNKPLPLKIDYIYYPGCKAQYEAGGLTISPAEPASIEIRHIWLYGHDLYPDWPESGLAELYERILEDHEDEQ